MMDDDDDEEILPCLVEVPFDSNKVVPVTILSGFLGSGKSTLLNFILTANHGKRIAVIENEFSQGLGIESMIAKSGVNGDNIANFFELNNGCICCTVKDDLLRTLEQLVLHKDRFDYVLIETTGMANPGPVITSFWSDKAVDSCLVLDGVVCVVDCLNISAYLSAPEICFEVKQQLCYADRILLNKCDLVAAEQVNEVVRQVRSINCLAEIEQTTFAKVNLDFVLSIGSYDSSSSSACCLPCMPVSVASHPEQSSVDSLALQMEGSFDPAKLQLLLDFLLYANGCSSSNIAVPLSLLEQFPVLANATLANMKIYRMKGVLHMLSSNELFILQAVYNLFELEPSSYIKGSAEDRSNGKNLLVIIGIGVDQLLLQTLFECCLVK